MRSSSNEDLDSTEMSVETAESESKDIVQEILTAKEKGTPDYEIIRHFGIEKKKLREVYNKAYGESLKISDRPKVIRRYQPKDFSLETGTVWSFKSRGSWATHDGRYRGNWSPYVPRNLILRYTKPGDTVLDCFVGGGTTAVEAKLLGRRCIARDINPGAIGVTRENLNFSLLAAGTEGETLPVYEPNVRVGDARSLSDIPDNGVDFVCTHPPYAGIIKYSSDMNGDLSALSVSQFYNEIGVVAKELRRVLRPGGNCAILIGDTRQSRRVLPIGFNTIRVFQEKGFVLRKLIIKKQHNCKTTGFWYERSIKYNFLLLAHEYLAVFSKPFDAEETVQSEELEIENLATWTTRKMPMSVPEDFEYETTTVWSCLGSPDRHVLANLGARLPKSDARGIIIEVCSTGKRPRVMEVDSIGLIYIRATVNLPSSDMVEEYIATAIDAVDTVSSDLPSNSIIAIECSDIYSSSSVYPVALEVQQNLLALARIRLKEIVILPMREIKKGIDPDIVQIDGSHRYLLIYEC